MLNGPAGTAIVLRPPSGADGAADSAWRDELADDLAAVLGASGLLVRVASSLGTLLELLADLGGAPVLLVDARTVLTPNVVRSLAHDPRVAAGLLVTTAGPRPEASQRAVRVDRGVVVEASSPLHQPVASRTVSVGAVMLDAGACAALPGAIDGLRAAVGEPALERAVGEGPVETLAAALLASGQRLGAVDARSMAAARVAGPEDAAAARRRRDAVDDDRAWLDAAVKARDGFFTTFFVSPYTRFLARRAARLGLTPNQITVVSMLVGVVAAGAFAHGGRGAAIVGAVALQVAFALDCVDGQLARYTQSFSSFGAWLDAIFDRGKEYVVYAGLAYGAARTGASGVWALAAAALAFQVVRHAIDFSFAAARPAPRVRAPVPLGAAAGSGAPAAGDVAVEPADAGRVLSAAAAAEDRPALKWSKRIIVFPIGERFAVISITAAVATPTVTFWILLGWGALAAAYTVTGRVLRARRW